LAQKDEVGTKLNAKVRWSQGRREISTTKRVWNVHQSFVLSVRGKGEIKMKRPQSDSKNRGGRKTFRHSLVAVIVSVASLWIASTAQAADGPEITREVRHAFSTVQHFDPIPECGFPGATEYATGNDHLILVDQGDSWHVTFMETFRVLEVPDDPAFPTIERKGTIRCTSISPRAEL